MCNEIDQHFISVLDHDQIFFQPRIIQEENVQREDLGIAELSSGGRVMNQEKNSSSNNIDHDESRFKARQVEKREEEGKSSSAGSKQMLLHRPCEGSSFNNAKIDRRVAQTSAIYYSECFLNGITPRDADHAATDVEELYQKWWLRSTATFKGSNNDTENDSQESKASPRKKKRTAHCPSSDNKDKNNDDDTKDHQPFANKHKKRVINDDDASTLLESNTTTCNLSKSVKRVSPLPSFNESFVAQKQEHLSPPSTGTAKPLTQPQIAQLRRDIVNILQSNGGEMEDPKVKAMISTLHSHYSSCNLDVRNSLWEGEPSGANVFPFDLNGTWLTLSKPTFSECRGQNDKNENIYSLGRLSFDMFRPCHLGCSIQSVVNKIGMFNDDGDLLPLDIPKSLRKSILGGGLLLNGKGLRSCNIIVSLTIEPNQNRSGIQESSPSDGNVSNHVQEEQTQESNGCNQAVNDEVSSSTTMIRRPIRGIMKNFGYLLPDPKCSNRLSTWFTGGSLQVHADDKKHCLADWKSIFNIGQQQHHHLDMARVLATRVLLGAEVSESMEQDGTIYYKLKRPIGGHGSVYGDVLYMDETLRITKGHNGLTFAFLRVKDDEEEQCKK